MELYYLGFNRIEKVEKIKVVYIHNNEHSIQLNDNPIVIGEYEYIKKLFDKMRLNIKTGEDLDIEYIIYEMASSGEILPSELEFCD